MQLTKQYPFLHTTSMERNEAAFLVTLTVFSPLFLKMLPITNHNCAIVLSTSVGKQLIHFPII